MCAQHYYLGGIIIREEETFYYKPMRDVLANIFGAIIAVIIFFAIKVALPHQILQSFVTNIDEIPTETMFLLFKWTYLGIVCVILCYCFFDIFIKTHQRLIIKTDEIIYVEGWITKKTKSIATHQIRSCIKENGPLQRMCHLMDITITTAGDIPEIYFGNIEDGKDAFEMLCEMAKRNYEKK